MTNRLLLAVLLLLSPIAACAETGGGVVASADPRASAAGQEMLRAGGSAADAALAMMLALTVVEPQSSGIGGGGFFVYHDAQTGVLATVDGRETAPAAARADRFLGPDGAPLGFIEAAHGGRSVGVPGNIRLAADAHRRWGKLPWATLFQPAIRLARDGFTVSPRMARFAAFMAGRSEGFAAIRSIYLDAEGRPRAAGTTMTNPALAGVLERLAAEGPDAFYRGDNAAAIIAAVGGAPKGASVITPDDLAQYQAKDRSPVCGMYRTFKICGMGPPSSGATTVLGILGMLERFDLKALGKDSPVAWHLIAEAMQLAYADREKYLGDPDFVDVPVAGLIDKKYLRARSAAISPQTSLPSYAAGTPPGAAPRTAAVQPDVPGTTNFVAADSAGNVVTMTSTVEAPFGSLLVANGYVLNNELTDFTFAPEKDGAPVANRVEPGKRPLSSMSPTVVYDADGRVVLALGSAGGKRIIMHVTKTLIGWIDFGLPAAEAIALPNIYFGGDAVLVEKNTALAAIQNDLARLGRTVVASDLESKVTAVERTPTGWRGAADPRSEGVALAQ